MIRSFSHVKLDALIGISGLKQSDVFNDCVNVAKLEEKKAKRLVKSVGFKQVRLIDPPKTTSDACLAGAKVLLKILEIDPKSVDGLIFITQTPDYLSPATSYILQKELDLSSETLLSDVTQGCAGFVYGLMLASNLISSKTCKRVLVCVGDVYNGALRSRILDLSQMSNIAVFGDGAGVALLSYDETAEDSFYSIENNGEFYDTIISPYIGFRYRFSKDFDPEQVKELHGANIDGAVLADYMLKTVKDDLQRICTFANCNFSDLSYCIAHQANKTLMSALSQVSNMPENFMPFLAENTGNTSSASIPLAISEKKDLLPDLYSKKVLLSGFGIGLSVASAVLSMKKTTILEPLYI